MALMTASEARFRVTHRAAMATFERWIEEGVMTAIENSEYHVSLPIPEGMTKEGCEIMRGKLNELGYAVKFHEDEVRQYYTITLEW